MGEDSGKTNLGGTDSPATASVKFDGSKFKRTYAVEIDFDTSIDFAEQDRLACVVLERLVNEMWEEAAAGTGQGNYPVTVVAYPIQNLVWR